ncbi:TPA: ash family protein [Salmonella enterica subsp. enterica serovar Muenchen]|nr:ash family protein [Salmonella enterica subsp. enterica serovar Muenchen]
MVTYKNCLLVSLLVSYIRPAPHKTGVGIGTPQISKAHNRASGFFTCKASSRLFRIMAGRAGQPQGWPGSLLTGSTNPVRLATQSLVPLAGEFLHIQQGASSWQTVNHAIPALTLSVSIPKPKSIAACSARIPSPEQCISTSCVMMWAISHRITSLRYSVTWLTTCAVCKNWRERRKNNPPENLIQKQHSTCWWGVCLHGIQEAL